MTKLSGRRAAVAIAAGIAVGAASPPARPATPVTPSGWGITPAGQSITVNAGPGLAGPWGVAVSVPPGALDQDGDK